MPRQTYVFRDGECIPKSEAIRRDAVAAAANVSDLPRPYIIGDNVCYRSMVDGSMITGRRQHRDHMREHGVIEVGNEKVSSAPKSASRPGEVAADIKTAIEQAKSGYVPPEGPVGQMVEEDGKMVRVEAPELEPIAVSGVPENGAMYRSKTTAKE